MKILKIKKESELEKNPIPLIINTDVLNQKLKNMTRAETFFMVKLGENWREHIIEGHSHHVPDLMVNTLEDIFSSRCDTNINNAIEAFKLWANKDKVNNLVGFFRLQNEYERHNYLKKHGPLYNSLIFAEIMGLNVASKVTQSAIAHFAVAGLTMVGVTVSAHVLLPVALLTIGLGFMGIKHKFSLPTELASLKRYNEESEMPLSRNAEKPKMGESIESMREKSVLSYIEVETVMKRIGFKNLGLMKCQSLQVLRNFTDDFLEMEKELKLTSDKLSGKDIANKVIEKWKENPENQEHLKEGRKHWFKHSLKEFLLLASPISLEVFPVLEHAIGGLVDETTSRILLKAPEAVAIAKESKSDSSGFEHISHSKNPETIKEKIKRFSSAPFQFKYNDSSINHNHHSNFKMVSKDDIFKNIEKQMKERTLVTAIKEVNNHNVEPVNLDHGDMFSVTAKKKKM